MLHKLVVLFGVIHDQSSNQLYELNQRHQLSTPNALRISLPMHFEWKGNMSELLQPRMSDTGLLSIRKSKASAGRLHSEDIEPEDELDRLHNPPTSRSP